MEFKTEAPGRDLTNGPATTMTTCPHCHQPIDDIRLGVRLTPLKAAIVDRIKAAGDIGTTTTEIVDDVYRDRSPVKPTAIKSHVGQINDLLASTD